jgi:hypothetical protein
MCYIYGMKYLLLSFNLFFINMLLVAQVNNSNTDSTKTNFLAIKYPQNFPSSLFLKLPNYYMNNLGVICKAELNLQKQTLIPIKFRLGSQQECDNLEWKNKIDWNLVKPDYSKFW